LSAASSGHLTVATVINGAGPYQFVIDTGAEGSAVYSWFSQAHGLTPGGGATIELQGQTGRSNVASTTIREVVVDGRQAMNVEAVILPDRADGVRLPGIVGLDVIGNYVADFNFLTSKLTLHPQGTPAGALGSRFHRVAAERLRGGLLGLPVRINGTTGVAVLDTGARDSRINWRFAAAAGLRPDSPGLVDDGTVQGATNTPMVSRRGSIGDVWLGGFVRPNVSTRIIDLPVFDAFGVGDRPAMILGMDLLRDTRMIVDFQNAEVWFATS
jgi:predicted aspartyl protease